MELLKTELRRFELETDLGVISTWGVIHGNLKRRYIEKVVRINE